MTASLPRISDSPFRDRDYAGGWVVSPVFDLLFLANIGWPLLFLPGMAWRSETADDFWQVYFLTLPHRWITLLLVPLDPDRRGGRGALLTAVAVGLLIFFVGVRLGTGALTCLEAADYIWNAWHFGAQHAGVLRIYGRKVGGGRPWLERHGLQAFATYAALRTASYPAGPPISLFNSGGRNSTRVVSPRRWSPSTRRLGSTPPWRPRPSHSAVRSEWRLPAARGGQAPTAVPPTTDLRP